jgi:hypothetical protein
MGPAGDRHRAELLFFLAWFRTLLLLLSPSEHLPLPRAGASSQARDVLPRADSRMAFCLALLLAAGCSRDAMSLAADAALAAPDAHANAADAAPGTPDAGPPGATCTRGGAGNPIVDGWYADPDMKVYGGEYWVYPTYSAPFDQQTFLDAFSSPDLVHWTKHARILDTSTVTWARRAIWAPSPIEKNGTYYLFFGANDVHEGEVGGIGVATATSPAGPFRDALGHPLINEIANGAQPIDQNVFIDDDGQAYLYYGGWGHCNVVKLNADLKSLGSFADGTTFKEITPPGYVEGALMFKRAGGYYLMWSEGGWTGPDYRVAYARSSSPTGPFVELGVILSQDATVATGSGHNTVVNVPGTDEWFIFYHRHPLGESDGNHRVLAYDRLVFAADGTIQPVKMTTQDDFCDGNSLGWSTRGGTWQVQAGAFAVDAATDARATLDDAFAAVDARVRVRVGAAGDAGLLVRATSVTAAANGYHGYYAGISAATNHVFIGKSNGSSYTELASAAASVDPDVDHRLRVVADGAQLSLYLDDAAAPVVSATDGDHAKGATGLMARATHASFDDVSVVEPAATAVTFFQDGGFGGASATVAAGDYTTAQLAAAGVPDNWMSSLRVPSGWTVQVFAADGWSGTSWTFTGDTALVPAEANDQMSSVKIHAP